MHAEPVSTADGSIVVNSPPADLSLGSTIAPPSSSSHAVIPDIDAATTRVAIEMLERVCADSIVRPTAGADDAGLGVAPNDSIGRDNETEAKRRLEFGGKSLAAIARDRFEARLQLLNRKSQV